MYERETHMGSLQTRCTNNRDLKGQSRFNETLEIVDLLIEKVNCGKFVA